MRRNGTREKTGECEPGADFLRGKGRLEGNLTELRKLSPSPQVPHNGRTDIPQIITCAWLLLLFSCSVVSNSFTTAWTVAHQAPLSIGFSRQECCSGFPFLSPGDLPDPNIEPRSPAWQEDSLPLSHQGNHNFRHTEGNTSKTLL